MIVAMLQEKRTVRVRCDKEAFPKGIFEKLPPGQPGQSCICKNCLEKFFMKAKDRHPSPATGGIEQWNNGLLLREGRRFPMDLEYSGLLIRADRVDLSGKRRNKSTEYT